MTFYKRLEPYWQNKVHLQDMDTDRFVLSFDANNQELTNFLQKKMNLILVNSINLRNYMILLTKKVIGPEALMR